MNEVPRHRNWRGTDALSFFSAEEVARARSYHRPLYWAGAADVAIEACVLAALVWSSAGAALDPGSLPWWGRKLAYAAIVVAVAAVMRTPLALWSGLIRERRWGFTTPSTQADATGLWTPFTPRRLPPTN